MSATITRATLGTLCEVHTEGPDANIVKVTLGGIDITHAILNDLQSTAWLDAERAVGKLVVSE